MRRRSGPVCRIICWAGHCRAVPPKVRLYRCMEHGVLGGVLGELFLGDIGASPEEKPSSRIFTAWTANDIFAKYLLVHDTYSGASLRALPRGRPSGVESIQTSIEPIPMRRH
jgi:hypothetical protein